MTTEPESTKPWKLWSLLVWLVTYVQLDLQLYYRWSRLGRRLFEKKDEGVVLPPVETPEDLARCLNRRFYTPDGPRQLWDMISSPGTIWRKYTEGVAYGDCDEFGILAATLLRNFWLRFTQNNRNLMPVFAGRRFLCPVLFTVVWLEPSGMPGGHNVCAFQYQDTDGHWYWAYVGNWFGGEVQYQGVYRSRMITENDLAAEISQLGGGRNVRWAKVRPSDLRLRSTGTAP